MYEVTDHMTVDPRFGTEDDFKELIDAAHDRGNICRVFSTKLVRSF